MPFSNLTCFVMSVSFLCALVAISEVLGATIVQMLKPGHSKTFMEYATEVFILYIWSQLQHQSHHRSCMGPSGSLKATARTNCEFTATASVPGNWRL